MGGGPNHVNNTCDAPIIVDFERTKYYKQPMYYHMAHISRFVLRNSYRISAVDDEKEKNKNLWYMAVADEQNLQKTVIVLLNTNANKSIKIEIYDSRKGFLQIT